ncbi:ABC transporter substrate-binding protein [Paenibacillus elgii]
MKKTVSILLMLAFLVLIAVGCSPGNGGTSSQTSTPAESKKKSEPVPIKLVVWGSGASETYKKIQDDFNNKHPEINLTIEMQGSYAEYLGAKTASNDLPDLFFLQSYTQVKTYAKNGMIMDLSQRDFTDKIFSQAKEAVSYDNKIYAYPVSIGFLGLIYNQELLDKAGIASPPKTVTELKEAFKKLKDLGITPFASSAKDSWTLNHMLSATQAATVGDNAAAWLKSMNEGTGSFSVAKTDSMFEALKTIRGNTNKNPLDSDYNNSIQMFATGKAAMIHNGEWAIADVLKINPNIKIGLTPIPISEDPKDAKLAVDAEINIAVNKNTKHPQEALKVLDYISDNKDMTGWMHYFTKEVSEPPAMPYAEKPPLGGANDVFETAVKSGNTVPWIYAQYPLDLGAGEILQAWFGGSKDKDAVIDEINKAWKKAVKQ